MDGLYTNTDTITNTQANTDSNTNIDTPTKAFIVDEIKTLRIAAADLPVSIQAMHWGQVKLYAYLYAVEQDLSSIVTQLSYYHLDSGELTELQQTFSFSELQAFFERKAVRFLQWTEQKLQWRAKRNQSIRTMAFPYGEFRGGQRAFSVSSYRAMAAAQQLFVQAPTGIGKTIGSLFPAIKAIAEGVHEKVFFLTAKTSGRAVAEHALDDMRSSGLQLKSVTLTAKENI